MYVNSQSIAELSESRQIRLNPWTAIAAQNHKPKTQKACLNSSLQALSLAAYRIEEDHGVMPHEVNLVHSGYNSADILFTSHKNNKAMQIRVTDGYKVSYRDKPSSNI